MKKIEETLCAWCGDYCNDSKFIYNGEIICLNCYEGAITDRIENHKFWEGVKDGKRLDRNG